MAHFQTVLALAPLLNEVYINDFELPGNFPMKPDRLVVCAVCGVTFTVLHIRSRHRNTCSAPCQKILAGRGLRAMHQRNCAK